MGFNGSGSFSQDAANFPAVPSTVIESGKYNNVINEVSTGLSTCILKDGQQTITADIPWGGNKITGLGAGASATDAANINNIQNATGVFVPSGSVGGTADAIELTPSPAITSYATGATFRWIVSGTNTSTVTVDVSGLGTKAVTKWSAVPLIAGDLQAGDMAEATYDGTQFILSSAFAPAFPDNGMNNLRIDASVSTKALTIALKGRDGTDPSATNPVGVFIRAAAETAGTQGICYVTQAESVTLSSGSSLNVGANGTIVIYVYLLRNSQSDGEIAVSGRAVHDERILHTTTAEGGAGGADSDIVLYSTTARTDVPIKLIGAVEVQSGAVAGEWDNAPDVVTAWAHGMKKSGDLIQTRHTQFGSQATGTTTTPLDDTIPQQSTEGTLFFTRNITPTNVLNILEIEARAIVSCSAGVNVILALHQDATENAIAATWQEHAADEEKIYTLFHRMVANSTSQLSFKIHIGPESAATVAVNGSTASRLLGGVAASTLTVKELVP